MWANITGLNFSTSVDYMIDLALLGLEPWTLWAWRDDRITQYKLHMPV